MRRTSASSSPGPQQRLRRHARVEGALAPEQVPAQRSPRDRPDSPRRPAQTSPAGPAPRITTSNSRSLIARTLARLACRRGWRSVRLARRAAAEAQASAAHDRRAARGGGRARSCSSPLLAYLGRDGYIDPEDDTISLLDAFYYSTVSITTTGYGDIRPVSDGARLVTTVIVTPARVLFLILLVGTTLEVLTERTRDVYRLSRWRKTLKDHVIICGFGTKGRAAATTLLRTRVQPRADRGRRREPVGAEQGDLDGHERGGRQRHDPARAPRRGHRRRGRGGRGGRP